MEKNMTIEQSTREAANRNSKSGVRGVCWVSAKKLWKAQIMHNRQTYHLGYFRDIQDAIDVRKEAERLVKIGTFPLDFKRNNNTL